LFRILDQPVTEMVERINSNGYYNAATPVLTAPKAEAKTDAAAPKKAANVVVLPSTALLAQPGKK
jgi:hypothetical protein